MHAMRCLLFFTTLLWSSAVLAIPLAESSASGLDPWVTLLESGARSTVTPVLTTISGTPTTINAFPSPTTATSVGVIPDGTAKPTPTSSNFGAFEICHSAEGEFAPLCPMPNNNTLYISETYYVTWDTSFFPGTNATVRVMANYDNATGGGPQAFESTQTLNSWGYVSLTIEKAWLQGLSSNNLTLYITSLEMSRKGPTITITSRPYQPFTPPAPTKAPTGTSLYIALPTVTAFVLLVVCGGCFINRKHRHIGLGNIMSRNRGYRPANKKSRRQRMGFGRKGDIKLGEVPSNWREDDPFTDKPGTGAGMTIPQSRKHHNRTASEALGSLVDTPAGERDHDAASWRFDFGFDADTPTRTKAVGDSGFVKEEVKIIEQHNIAARRNAS